MMRNHVMCLACFTRRKPGIEPVRFRGYGSLECCFCATQTREGIFLRAYPAEARYCQCEAREAARGRP